MILLTMKIFFRMNKAILRNKKMLLWLKVIKILIIAIIRDNRLAHKNKKNNQIKAKSSKKKFD